MKIKTTAKATKKAPVNKRTTKAKGRSLAAGRLSRSKRSAGAVTTGTTDATPPRHTSKKAMIEALVRRTEGAVTADLMAATGWQEHSVRAALTGLRKAGHAISRDRNDSGTTRYRLAGAV